ncbi:MAG: D-alanine--D-alanine ligase [Deltaproteobacteria bacterium]|jgi:D-alanine-D-alanine ligase|nr:D-alanine--D-alanine ligase [Deltaproteobacteria bacterium]
MNILLIAGGWSGERQVSLNGAANIEAALNRLGHSVKRYDPEHSLTGLCDAVQGMDFAFINLHGAPGEDGLVQSMLEALRIPYQGSSPAGSFLALNKDAAKAIFRKHNLVTPDWIQLTDKPASDWSSPFGYPIFVKHSTGGSSLGMAKISSTDEAPAAFDKLFSNGWEYIVEPACNGVEVTCAVLGSLREANGKLTEAAESLPPILILPKTGDGKFFDYTSKYVAGAAEEICPAPLPEDVTRRIQEISLKAHEALGLRGYSRADFILPEDGQPILLEVNSLPGMTSTSLVPRAAAAHGLSFDALIDRLIKLGLLYTDK